MAHLHKTLGTYYRTAIPVEDGVLVRRSSTGRRVLVRRSSTGRQVEATRTSTAVQTVPSKEVRALAPFWARSQHCEK